MPETTSKNETPEIKNGKNVYVYRFGGKGNDLCFVRTPDNYDHSRQTPYPFVICNHGNGWRPDGTVKFANWTKRTMYLPKDDPDVQNGSEQYNVTSDEELLYSNPTIESLLKNGYIVCGCQNHADLLFGNDDCRNACADFFFHITENFNTEKSCYMIGASNGALTSINTVYLLGNRVKALYLQYPLTCLINQYESYPKHRPLIRKAYGIKSENITKDELKQVLSDHDLLHNGVERGKLIRYFPPTEIVYSKSDSVVNYRANALAAAELLTESGILCKLIEVKGEHGDHSHFLPEEMLAWFKCFK